MIGRDAIWLEYEHLDIARGTRLLVNIGNTIGHLMQVCEYWFMKNDQNLFHGRTLDYVDSCCVEIVELQGYVLGFFVKSFRIIGTQSNLTRYKSMGQDSRVQFLVCPQLVNHTV